MWARLLVATVFVLTVFGQNLRWESPWSNGTTGGPEPRSFATVAGVPSTSTLFMYGGFSHARNHWLNDVWSIQLNESVPQWKKVNVAEEDPWEHASLVELGGVLLLTGGMRNGTISNSFYQLAPLGTSSFEWSLVPPQDDSDELEPVYWHSAVSYTVDGQPRALLCGGVVDGGDKSAKQLTNNVYELSYNATSKKVGVQKLEPMPLPLMGHSLAVGADSSVVYVSGGLSGSLKQPPKYGMPYKLAAAMNGTASYYASKAVYRFNRTGGDNATGMWEDQGTMKQAVALHASWISGSSFFVYGGAQENAGGLQAFKLPANGARGLELDTAAMHAAQAQWNVLQPGALSGAAAWVDTSVTDATDSPRLWLLGGWITPQPLPLSADRYFCPQDTSFAWRWTPGTGSTAVGRWLAPLQGAMAPRSAGNGRTSVTAVTVGGARKLLVMGGVSVAGWTGYEPATPLFDSDISETDLALPPRPSLRAYAKSYHLYDVWLINQDTGARELVWVHRSIKADVPSTTDTNTFGSVASQAPLGPVWDRRLLEAPDSTGTLPGGSTRAIYMHVVEDPTDKAQPLLKASVWRLSLSPLNLDANSATTLVTWQLLITTQASKTSTPVEALCYPRTLYGAAYLRSPAVPNTSYIAVHGGLRMRVSASVTVSGAVLGLDAFNSTCVLEVSHGSASKSVAGLEPAQARWLSPPDYPTERMPEARYRHACAPRPGSTNYSMTCYGGVSAGKSVLADAWTFNLQPGVNSSRIALHMGAWTAAPPDLGALRPGPRADHVMLALRGTSMSDWTDAGSAGGGDTRLPASDYSPLLLVGGATNATAARRNDVWLGELAGVADAEANSASSLPPEAPRPAVHRTVQVWLAVGAADSADAAAKTALGVETSASRGTWQAAAGTVAWTQEGRDLWLLMEDVDPSSLYPLVLVRMRSKPEGCWGAAVRPNTTVPYKYGDDAVAACWLSSTTLDIVVTREDGVELPANSKLFASGVGFVLQDSDGAGVQFKNQTGTPTGYILEGVRLTNGTMATDLTVVAYGKPYIEIGHKRLEQGASGVTAALPFKNSLTLNVKVQMQPSAPLGRVTVELRVLSNNVVRKRGCCLLDFQSLPNGTGLVSYEVINSTSDSRTSYVIIINTSTGSSYYAVLPSGPSPPAMASLGPVTTSLLSSADDSVTYLVNVATEPPSTSVSVTFRPAPNTTLKFALLSAWYVSLYKSTDGQLEHPVYCANATYPTLSSPIRLNLPLAPGPYRALVFDGQVASPWLALDDDLQLSATTTASLDVIMSTVSVFVSFSGIVRPGQASGPQPAFSVMMELHVAPETGDELEQIGKSTAAAQGCRLTAGLVNTLWFQAPCGTDPKDPIVASVVPNVRYNLTFRFAPSTSPPSTFTPPLNGVQFVKVPVDNGNGTSIAAPVTLPYTLLCSEKLSLVNVKLAEGQFPTVGSAPIAYPPGSNCTWIISTGQTIINVRISASLPPGATLQLFYDNFQLPITFERAEFARSFNVPNVTLVFHAGLSSPPDNNFGSFTFTWSSSAGVTTMPPQFIMMIAASSAAAGAMLLFLCLWHCVFRPVQLRRQQAAAAQAAAASAAAVSANAAAARNTGHRNRVPRRYLRMMETSTYSIKDTQLAFKTAAEAPPVATGAAAAGEAGAVVARDGGTGRSTDVSKPLGGGGKTSSPVAAGPTPAASKSNLADAASATPDAAAANTPALPSAATGTSTTTAVASASDVGGGSTPASVAAGGAVSSVAAVASSGCGPASQSEPEGPAGEVCAICLCDFEDGDRVKHLPCKHFFHTGCIDQWLGRDITCPLCKDNVLEALKNIFGPLPPRGMTSARQQQQQQQQEAAAAGVGDEDGGGAEGGGGGGAGAGTATSPPPPPLAVSTGGADLEMVVIVPHTPSEASGATRAVGGSGGGGGGGGGGGARMGLPGSAVSFSEPGEGLGAADGGGGAAAPITSASGVGSTPQPRPVALEPSAADQILRSPSPTHGGSHLNAGATSRELRPMRRNISTDLTAEASGTSSDSDSDSGSEIATVTTITAGAAAGGGGRRGSSTGRGPGSGGSATGVSARAFQNTSQQSSPSQQPRPQAAVSVNQLMVASPSGGSGSPLSGHTAGGGASQHVATSDLNPTSRAVVEGVQHSPTSVSGSVSALRWIGGGSTQVLPIPRVLTQPGAQPSSGAAQLASPHQTSSQSPVNSPRRPRAQEAQMAAAAAALSAAAAGVSGGGNNLRTASVTSIGSSMLDPSYNMLNLSSPQAAAAAAAAVAVVIASGSCSAAVQPAPPDDAAAHPLPPSVLAFRVHNNPLAHSSRRGQSGGSAETTASWGLSSIASVGSTSSGAAGHGGGAAIAAAPSIRVLPSTGSPSSQPGIAMFTAGSPSRFTLGGPSGGELSRLGPGHGGGTGVTASGGGGGGGAVGALGARSLTFAPALAVPDVSSSCEDLVARRASLHLSRHSSRPGAGTMGSLGSGGGGGGGGSSNGMQ